MSKKDQEAENRNEEGAVKEVPLEEQLQEKQSFEEQLSEAVEQNTENLYTSLLKQADERIKAQQQQIAELQQLQLNFRDDIAVQCYAPLINATGDNKQAAISAYQAADAFLRARETGLQE